MGAGRREVADETKGRVDFNPKKGVWTEKYRPNKVSTMVLDNETKTVILNYLATPTALPNFLLFSKSPGTGKTTLAKAIIKELDCDYIIINSSDDRGLESVREKVKQFCLTTTSKEGLKRCVFLDEVDGMLKPAQEALRNMMETYGSNAFFVLTANNVHKVIEPLQSRCRKISFAYPEKPAIITFLEGICQNEGMDYSLDGIGKLVDLNYPSIRDCVNVLQDLSTAGKPVLPDTVKPFNAVFDDIWELLQKRDYQSIKKLVLQGTLEPRELNLHIWERAMENDSFKIIQITCRNEKDMADGANPKVVFISSVPEMIK